MALLCVAGQRPGIEAVAFAQGPERADEGLDLARVGTVGGASGGQQGGQERVLVAAGRLADDEAGAIQAGGEGGERLGCVGQGVGAAVAAVAGDDAGLADVAADEAGWGVQGDGLGHGSYPDAACDCLRASCRLAEGPRQLIKRGKGSAASTRMTTGGSALFRDG